MKIPGVVYAVAAFVVITIFFTGAFLIIPIRGPWIDTEGDSTDEFPRRDDGVQEARQ